MQRPMPWSLGVFATLLAICTAVFLVGCVTPNRAAPPQSGDCHLIKVWSNGFHTSLGLRAEAFAPEHPVRALFPDAEEFLIGYGAQNYYQNPDPGAGAAIAAIIPPTPAVLHIIAARDGPVEAVWRPSELVMAAVSNEGLANIVADIEAAMVMDEEGNPQIVGEGRVAGASAFVKAEPGFHFFHMCNQWTAARLSAGGAKVCPGLAFQAPGLIGALDRGAAPSQCPPAVE